MLKNSFLSFKRDVNSISEQKRFEENKIKGVQGVVVSYVKQERSESLFMIEGRVVVGNTRVKRSL